MITENEAPTAPPALDTEAPKVDPAAAKIRAKAEKKAAKLAAKGESYAAKLARNAEKHRHKLAAKARMQKAREEFPDLKDDSPLKRSAAYIRAHLAVVWRGLDAASSSLFLRIVERGILLTIILAVIVVYILDMFFFGTKAPADLPLLIPVFIVIGFVFRTAAVTAGVLLESLKERKEEVRARATWRAIFVASVIACMISAVSFFVGGYQLVSAKEDKITSVASASKMSVDDQVKALDQQAEDIRSDSEKQIATIQAASDKITTDKSAANDGEATELAREQAKEREAARIALAEIAKEKTRLIASKGAVATTEATDLADAEVQTSTAWAGFSWFSSRTGANERDVVDIGMLFLALLLEFIAAFGPGAYYALRRKFVALARLLGAKEQEEIAELDQQIAQIEARTELARAMAAAARTAELDDDEAVLQQAKAIEADAARELEIAKAEQRAKAIREEIDRLRNPPPPVVPVQEKPPLTEKQQQGQNGGLGADLMNKTRDQIIKVPVGKWSGRADRIEWRMTGS